MRLHFITKRKIFCESGKPATVFGTYLPGDKKYIYDYDIWSNIHYGYAGRMSGFQEVILDLGAKIHDAAKGHLISDTFSDRNKDANAVQLGIKLYDKYGANLKKETLEKEIFENRASLNRYPRRDLIEKIMLLNKGKRSLPSQWKTIWPLRKFCQKSGGEFVLSGSRAGRYSSFAR